MVARSVRTIKIFYCYAPEDDDLREQLARHLSPFRRIRYITGWYNRDIQAGADWVNESEKHLDAADIILLLLSADFFTSDYLYREEMQRAINRHKAGTAHVIPILLRPFAGWKETPPGELRALPANETPVTQWANRDEAWLNVVQGIREVVRDLVQKHPLSLEENDVLYPEQGRRSGQIVGEKYLLGELLGEGGFSQVYKAQHIEMQRQQAIKVLHEHHCRKPEFRERFRLEAHTIASLNHHYIIHLDDFWTTEDGQAYLVMPFISGGTLQGILDKQQGFLEQDQVIFYFECMCTALDYAHKKEIAHLDLKPQNFLVHENGELLLSDFGLARLLKQGRITGGSSLRSGTPHYMAPEHIKGSPEKRSDLFSLGVILYQMLVGRLPFDELPGETILLKNMMEWPPAPRELRPDLPEAVEDMLAKALAKRPEQRYQTANEFLMAFKNALKRDLQIVVHQPPDTLGTQRKPLTDMFDGKAPQPEGHAPEQSRGNVAPLPPISPNREQTRPGDYQQMEKEWLQEAKGHCAARRYDEALAGYQHILRLNPQSVEAHMQLAYIYSDRQQYDEALSALKQASPVVPDDPSILMFHADLLSGLKRSQEALDTYEQILSLAPDHMPAMVGRVKLLRLLGRHEEALTACEGILSRDPGHLDAQQWKVALLHQLATAHYKRGKELVAEKRLLGKPYKLYSQALAAFDQAIQFDPSFAAAYRERGDLLKALKRPTEALGAYDTAIELGMNDFATWIKTGHVLLQQKAYAQALKRAERAEEQIAPDSIDRDQRLAEVYVIKMKALKGLELIDEAGKLRERLPGLLNE